MAARVVVIGSGYVGLTLGACLATVGHHVTCVDSDEPKVRRLSLGQVTIREPRLTGIIGEGLDSGHLRFGTECSVGDAEVVFLCLPTPMGDDGRADLSAVTAVVLTIREALSPGCVVVIKSTVPVGTAARVAQLIGRTDVAVVSNPEFLREGSAVTDFLKPDRIVIGSDDSCAAGRVAALYGSLSAPILHMDTASAELVKYASNGFLAMKLSYVNDLAELCERLGANVTAVTTGMGYDPRVGQSYLQPGPGWGGACLPKDTAAILHTASQVGMDLALLRASIDSNERHRRRVLDRIRSAAGGSLAGKRIGLLGLTFKAGTNDLRHSPALDAAGQLAAAGAELAAYDPAVPQEVTGVTDDVTVTQDAYQAVKDADVVVLMTEWSTFRTLDWARVAALMAGTTIVDTRNCLDSSRLADAGITWAGVGIGGGSKPQGGR